MLRMFTKFHENQGPVTYFYTVLIHPKCTIFMFQCKTDLVLITMLECLLVESDMFSIFPYYGLANKLPLNFNSK